MLSVDHLNTDGPPLAVKCVRKFGSALGGEVTSVCVIVCILSVCILKPLITSISIAKAQSILTITSNGEHSIVE